MIALTTEEGVGFVDKLYSDLMPAYSSKYFVIGGDETYEIGLGKSKAMADEIGKGETYLYCLNEIYKLTKKYDKVMMYWGDIILHYPDLVDLLPKDAIAMNWGYEYDHNFARETETFFYADIPYYVCPGTASWGGIMGRVTNMLLNCEKAAYYGIENEAAGLHMTDWGDGGHWQHLPISYPGYVYGPALAWCYDANLGPVDNNGEFVAKYLSRFVFMDETEQMGELLLSIGDYSQNMEKRCWNNTYINMAAHTNYTDDGLFTEPWTYQSHEADAVVAQTDAFVAALDSVNLRCKDADILMAEFRSGAELLKVSAQFASLRRRVFDGENTNTMTEAAVQLQQDYKAMQVNYKASWLSRNLYSNLDDSLSSMSNIGNFASWLILN